MDGFLRSLPKLDTSYLKSKEEAWEELSRRIDSRAVVRPPARLVIRRPGGLVAAAVIVLVLGAALFARFYAKTIATPAGNHLTQLLPDGSVVEMNAGSTIRFKPLWWYVEREVIFEGEAFFKVRKGKTFQVLSELGRVTVLGTSFNIFARENHYRVTCYSGKVRVVAGSSGHSVDITSNDEATLNRDGSLRLSHLTNPEETISWINHEFYFTGTPLPLVFDEIERQYGVRIVTKKIPDYLYTGNFTGRRPLEEVLGMVCKPYGLAFYPVKDGFMIEQK